MTINQSQFTDGIAEMLRKHSILKDKSNIDFKESSNDNLLQDSVFFWTLIPFDKHIPKSKNGKHYTLKSLSERVHREFIFQSICHPKKDNSPKYPITLFCMEPEGARSGNKRGLELSDGSHVHGITVLRTSESARRFLRSHRKKNLVKAISIHSNVRKFEMENLNTYDGTANTLVEYISKYSFWHDTNPQSVNLTWDIINYLPKNIS